MRYLKMIVTTWLIAIPIVDGGAEAATLLSSGATAASVNIGALGIVKANAAIAPVAGSSTAAYDSGNGIASVDQSTVLTSGITGSATEGLNTGIVSTEASATLAVNGSATGTTSLANASDVLASRLPADPLPVISFGISADAITSTTTVTGGVGGPFGTGTVSLAGLDLTGTALGALQINGMLYSNPAANTVLLSLDGLKVILNEQIRSSSGAGDLLMQTNAIHVALSNYALAGKVFDGDIILGHSQAEINTNAVAGAVPEPATWATMLIGFGAIGAAIRRQRKPLAAA